PFGIGEPDEDPDGDGEEFVYRGRFAGQYFDGETGLYYNYFRDYEPRNGRYVESDPIGVKGGLNAYNYGNSNPIAFIDARGLAPAPWCSWIDIVSGNCPEVGEGKDIEPGDLAEEWIKKNVKDLCNKPCDKIARQCRRSVGPYCYGAGTSCLVPCFELQRRCEEYQKENCTDKLTCKPRKGVTSG
ncbi:hypothetical protein GWM83_00390, partial [Candidatus Bathyarchaeota archaeon]|nr:RHS repeat-associated core domain-containing protein [Candidatus Bathyarchaeota archaeon]NIW34014.1 hypothetical protein [Candidatus Bathyarchaeota archaeon]